LAAGSLGERVVDRLASGVAHEAKVGYIEVNERIKQERTSENALRQRGGTGRKAGKAEMDGYKNGKTADTIDT